MFKTLMLAIVAVLTLQSQDSLARHTAAHRVIEAIRAFEARVDALEAGDADQQALIDDLQVQIDDLQAQADAGHPPTHTVFVTSERSDGNLGGLTGADATCQALADGQSSIVPPGTYLAWLSDSTGAAPINRFTQSSIPYVLPDGSQVVSDFTDLTDGNLSIPINIDETGVTHTTDVGVWTNT